MLLAVRKLFPVGDVECAPKRGLGVLAARIAVDNKLLDVTDSGCERSDVSPPSVPATHCAHTPTATTNHRSRRFRYFPRWPARNVKTGSKPFTRTSQVRPLPRGCSNGSGSLRERRTGRQCSQPSIANPPNHETAPVTNDGCPWIQSPTARANSQANTSLKRRAKSFQPASRTVDPQPGAFTSLPSTSFVLRQNIRTTCARQAARSKMPVTSAARTTIHCVDCQRHETVTKG